MTHSSTPAPSPTPSLDTEAPPDSTEPAEQPIYIRIYFPPAIPDPDKGTFERLVLAWAMNKGHGIDCAIAFVNRMSKQHLLNTDVQQIVRAVELLPEKTDQALAIELVAGGAFTRRELKEPKEIVAYFARPDWAEIVEAWRESLLPKIGQVIQGMEADRRRQSKKIKVSPPPASPGHSRNSRDVLVGQLKAALPRTLRDSATDLTEALRALAADPIVSMDPVALAAAVKRRRVGTGTKVCDRVIASGLPHLAKLGYVTIEGDKARICPGALV